MDQARAIDPLSADWIAVVLVLAVGTLAWINAASPKKWRLLTRSLFSLRLGRQSMRDDLDIQDRTLIGLCVLASALIALFTYLAGVMHGAIADGAIGWAMLFGAALALCVVQCAVVIIASFLFQRDGGGREYVFTLLLLWITLGLVLLPVDALLAFPHRIAWRPALFWAGIALAAGMLVSRWVRAVAVGTGEGVSLRYIFIYLCTLEILPFLLAVQRISKFLPAPHPN